MRWYAVLKYFAMKKILLPFFYRAALHASMLLATAFFLLPFAGKTQCPNDECSGAIVLTMHQDDCSMQQFNRYDCTSSGGPDCGNNDADMWFEVTSTQSAFVLSVNMGAWDCRGAVGVFDGCGGSLLQCAIVPLGTGVWDIPINLPAGTYKIRLQTESADLPPDIIGICDGIGMVRICAWEGACAYTQVTTTGVVPTCGEPNGSVTASPSGGGPYTYNWSNGGTTQTISNLDPWHYSVTVTSNNGCAAVGYHKLHNGANFTINVTSTPSVCGSNNGTATAVVSQFDPPNSYTFQWSNGGSTQTITGLPPGTYTVTVSGTNWNNSTCVKTGNTTVTVDNPINVTTTTQVSCGLNNGSATANPTGGSGYTYAWSNGGTSQTINNLSAGTYTVTVTSSQGCTNSASATVNGSTGISATVSATHPTCGLNNGSATANSSGGSGYTYDWSNGGSTQTISNLAAGTYTVTVTASNGCTQTQSATLTEPPALSVVLISIMNASAGQSNGSIEVSASGGVSPYQYGWTNMAGDEIGNQPVISGLPAGIYTLSVADANGCEWTQTYTIQSVSSTHDKDLENHIQLFPNPTSGQVTLLLENPGVSYLLVEVFDALGKRVASHPKVEIVKGSGGLDFSGYAPGYYLLKIVIGDRAVVKWLAVSR